MADCRSEPSIGVREEEVILEHLAAHLTVGNVEVVIKDQHAKP